EHLDDQEALVRARRRAQPVRQLDRARHAGTEADAVVGAVDVVVHRLGYGDDVHTYVVQTLAVAEHVVTPERDQHVHTDVLEVLEHVLGDVVDRLLIAGDMRRHPPPRQVAGPHARRMEERAAGAPGPVDDGFRERLDVLAVVGFRVARIVHEPRPAASDTYDLVAVAQRENRGRAG